MKKKRNKKLIALLGTAIFVIVGTSAFLIGAKLSGWDIWGWFITPQAYLVYALLFLFLCAIGWAYWVISHKESDD